MLLNQSPSLHNCSLPIEVKSIPSLSRLSQAYYNELMFNPLSSNFSPLTFLLSSATRMNYFPHLKLLRDSLLSIAEIPKSMLHETQILKDIVFKYVEKALHVIYMYISSPCKITEATDIAKVQKILEVKKPAYHCCNRLSVCILPNSHGKILSSMGWYLEVGPLGSD